MFWYEAGSGSKDQSIFSEAMPELKWRLGVCARPQPLPQPQSLPRLRTL